MSQSSWTFLTNHAHVLLTVARNPDIRIRDIADKVGITERAAQRILKELTDEGYLNATKVGRRNSYTVDPKLPLRHPLEHDVALGRLVDALGGEPAR